MNIAICFSGGLRSFPNCVKNIKDNIINPLEQSGMKVYNFISTWDIDNWYQYDITKSEIKFNMIEIEKYDKSLFSKFISNKYREYPHLSGPDTHINSISMHYKIYRVWKLMEQFEKNNNITFDIIIRLRPDIIYSDQINIRHILDVLTNPVIYMPKWHGKYEIVTRQIMDQYAFGNRKVMKQYHSVYENIDNLLKSDYPHTGEGFLYAQIKDINIQRIPIGYYIVRKNSKIHFPSLIEQPI